MSTAVQSPEAEEAVVLDPPAYKELLPGDLFPWLTQACGDRASFSFQTLAGRYQLFCFFLGAHDEDGRAVLDAVSRRREMFDDVRCSFVGVSIFSEDRDLRGVRNIPPAVRFAWDFDHEMSRQCGVTPLNRKAGDPIVGRRIWILVDPSLHVLKVFPLSGDTVDAVLDEVASLPPPWRFGGIHRPAPVLVLPNVFEPELCRRLIEIYEESGGQDSGVLRDGKLLLDHSFKRRRDHALDDPDLLKQVNGRIGRRVIPEIEKTFFMKANFIERHSIACYSSEDGGFFSPHRDNGPGLSAHRRFAVSINLNDDFEGGQVVFPEYNLEGYKAPAGWAVVFPCGALHQVNRVTKGARYAFLPFLYDEAGRRIRHAEIAKAEAAAAAATSPTATP